MSRNQTDFKAQMAELGIFFSDQDCQEIEEEWQAYKHSLEYNNVLFFQRHEGNVLNRYEVITNE